jgi:hypothetical protein
MNRHVRIEAINTSWPPDYERTDPLLLDMVIDDEAHVVGRHFVFGLQGDPAVRETWEPFVMRENGDVHFSGNEEGDSYFRTNLREKQIAPGEVFTSFDRLKAEIVWQITKVFEVATDKVQS